MIDLHCHSTASDGSYTPAQLAQLAAQINLKALALTDHDTIDGLDEFDENAPKYPSVRFIPGIELSCRLSSGNPCHIVGLFIDKKSQRLQEACRQYCAWRAERNKLIVEKLRQLGFDISYDDVKATKAPGDDVIGRPHIANALVAKGYCKNSRDAFDKLIGRGRPAYAQRQVLDAQTCLDTIHDAGGLAIWAHPMTSSSMTYLKCERNIAELKQFGLDGIEAYYTEHTTVQIKNVIAIAKKSGILVSGGSDFHGTNQKGIYMGTGHGNLAVPDELLPPILAKLQGR